MSHKSEMAGPFSRGDTIINRHFTSWLSYVMFNCVFVTFTCGILGQVGYLIVSIPDLCHLSYIV